MLKNLQRRIKKLEQRLGTAVWEVRLRALARGMGADEETYLEAARGHERELGAAMGDDGTITWEGFLLLRSLLAKRSQR